LAKTEFIHFTTGREAQERTLTLPDNTIVEPKKLVKWLGIYFDQNLTFKEHVAIRVSQARSAFNRMARLANCNKGLSPLAVRQIYMACITSIADYGSIIWWRGQNQFKKPLQLLQNLALRKILGVFKTAPIIPIEVEAALPPPYIRLNNSLRRYAFRALKLAPNHPIPAEIEKSITTMPSFDIIDDIYDQNKEDELAIANYHQITSFDASITLLVTTITNPINQVFRSQGAEVNNSALNSSIARIAQLSISATVQENQTNQEESISPATASIATSPDASIVPFHYLYQDPTRDRARASIADNIPLFQKSTDVTCVPPLANQNNSISSPEEIGKGSFRASLAPLVTSTPNPANQTLRSQ
jgi:hypothetical protein